MTDWASFIVSDPLTPAESVFIQSTDGHWLNYRRQGGRASGWIRQEKSALGRACAGAQSDAIGTAQRRQDLREDRIIGEGPIDNDVT